MTQCISCGSTESNKFYMVTGGFNCQNCYETPKDSVGKSHLPLFERWICTVHNCGSYNFNSLGRHEMPWCEITKETTVGILKPKTFGGYNGNVNRHYFRDWQEFCKKKDQEKHAIAIWNNITKHLKKKPKFKGSKFNFRKKKNANRFNSMAQFA